MDGRSPPIGQDNTTTSAVVSPRTKVWFASLIGRSGGQSRVLGRSRPFTAVRRLVRWNFRYLVATAMRNRYHSVLIRGGYFGVIPAMAYVSQGALTVRAELRALSGPARWRDGAVLRNAT